MLNREVAAQPRLAASRSSRVEHESWRTPRRPEPTTILTARAAPWLTVIDFFNSDFMVHPSPSLEKNGFDFSRLLDVHETTADIQVSPLDLANR